MNKKVTSIRVKVEGDETLTRQFSAAELGPTVVRQRAASYAVAQHAMSRQVTSTEYYEDGTCCDFRS